MLLVCNNTQLYFLSIWFVFCCIVWYVYTLTISISVTRFMECEKIYEIWKLSSYLIHGSINSAFETAVWHRSRISELIFFWVFKQIPKNNSVQIQIFGSQLVGFITLVHIMRDKTCITSICHWKLAYHSLKVVDHIGFSMVCVASGYL
jgi:hypothetical protein